MKLRVRIAFTRAPLRRRLGARQNKPETSNFRWSIRTKYYKEEYPMRNLKRALSLAVASVMLLGMMVVGTSAGFEDVTSAHNEEAIAVMEKAGVMIGSDGKFNPDQKVTRNEAAVVISNLLGLKAADYAGTSPFTDVPAWAEPYVAAVYANGITAGISATEFGGNNDVTVAQFSLWAMKALGYFQNQADFGEDWQMATVKQASKLELAKGVKGSATTAMTRNDVAKLVLNALQKDVVEFEGALGTDITTSDGTAITVGYLAKYEAPVYDNTYKYDSATDNKQQLTEKLFGNKLTKAAASASQLDVFGNPANYWKWNNKDIGKYAMAADLTYVGEVTEKTLYADLGLSANATGWTVYVDGVSLDTISNQTIDKNDTSAIYGTNNGADVAVYTDEKIITVKNYFMGEVTAIDEKNANDKREIFIDNASSGFETTEFAEEDMVIFTEADGVVKSVAKIAAAATGKITKTVGSDKVYIDGVEYKLAQYWYNPDSVALKDTVKVYTNANGAVIGFEEVETAVTLSDLALFVRGGADRTAGYAELIFADGTKKLVDTKADYTVNNSFDANNDGDKTDGSSDKLVGGTIVKFEVKDGVYELSYANSVAASGNAIVKGNPVFGTDKVADSETVFVYCIDTTATPDGFADEFKVVTGYKNAIGGTASSIVTYTKTTGAVDLAFVNIAKGSLSSTAADITFIAVDADAERIVEDGKDYYTLNAVVDGKVTTVDIDYSLRGSLTGDFLALQSITYNSKDIGTTLGSAYSMTTAANDTIKVSNGVVTMDTAGTPVSLTYDEDTLVVVVDDGAIEVIDVTKIAEDNDGLKDPYKTIKYTVCTSPNAHILDVIVLVKK